MRGNLITRDEMLAIPAFEISNLSRMAPEPLVSVVVVTYNHEKYIEQAIEGILAQQCDFPFELIIGEDKSTDKTLEICLNYQEKHPDLIRVVTWRENLGISENYLRSIGRSRGKYIALLEGDDYWIDPAKLTKQVALMEQFPDTSLCGAWTRVVTEVPGKNLPTTLIGPEKSRTKYSLKDVMTSYLCHTSTFLLRKSKLCFTEHFRATVYPDVYLQCLSVINGSLRCLPDVVSVWRHHSGGLCIGGNPYLHYDLNVAIREALLDVVNPYDARYVKIGIDLMQYKKCHHLINDGRISEARQMAPGLLRRLFGHDLLKALILSFHVCLPKSYAFMKAIKGRCQA